VNCSGFAFCGNQSFIPQNIKFPVDTFTVSPHELAQLDLGDVDADFVEALNLTPETLKQAAEYFDEYLGM
jgi:hypothetical protein